MIGGSGKPRPSLPIALGYALTPPTSSAGSAQGPLPLPPLVFRLERGNFSYGRVSDEEFESGGETRASGVGNEDGSSNPASYRPG
jgi:hypothetical protein